MQIYREHCKRTSTFFITKKNQKNKLNKQTILFKKYARGEYANSSILNEKNGNENNSQTYKRTDLILVQGYMLSA